MKLNHVKLDLQADENGGAIARRKMIEAVGYQCCLVAVLRVDSAAAWMTTMKMGQRAQYPRFVVRKMRSADPDRRKWQIQ